MVCVLFCALIKKKKRKTTTHFWATIKMFVLCLLVRYTVHTKSTSWRNVFGLKITLHGVGTINE